MTNRNAARCRNHPPDVLIVPIPQVDTERQVRLDVMQVRIGKLPKQIINAEMKLGGRAPKLPALRTEFFKQAEGFKLATAIFFQLLTYENKKENTILTVSRLRLGRHPETERADPPVPHTSRPSPSSFFCSITV